MRRIDTTAIVSEDISSPALLATFTATEDGEIYIQVYLTDIVGGGTYKACFTKQLGGVGVAHQSPTTAVAVISGTSDLFMPSIAVPVQEDDVVKVYIEGTVPDVDINGSVEIFDGAYNEALATMQADLNDPDQYKATGFAVAGDEMDLVDAPNALAIDAIQDGLALEATLDEIKGGGFTDQDLVAIKTEIDLKLNSADYTDPDNATIANIEALIEALMGAGWTDETLVALMTAIESGAIDEVAIRNALGMSNANLDTQLENIQDAVNDIIVEDVLDVEVEDGLSLVEVLRIILSSTANMLLDSQTGVLRFRDVANTKDRLVVTVDGFHNRVSVVRDGS